MTDTDLRYPVGRFKAEGEATVEQRTAWTEEIQALPARLRAAVVGLTEEQLDTPYRPDGWTVRQVIHHLPDSHLNAYIRFKLALTEDSPTIKPYDEAAWAKLPDSRITPPEISLALLESLHIRWLDVVRSMAVADYSRVFLHPEHGRRFRLDEALGLYAWHGRHHLAHITRLAERLGW